jgi:hypothetical protein
MDKKDIIGFYKNWTLVEQNGKFYVVDRTERKVLFKGTEEEATKTFTMLVANFINNDLEKIEV